MGSTTRTAHPIALPLLAFGLWLGLAHGHARAASAQELGARARVTQTPGAVEEPAASATAVSMDGRAAAAESVGDVLVEVPGARPVRTGSLGSFTSASIRGAELDHTSVLLGTLPLSGADAAAFDLSTVPASLLERVVVYRGGAPVWLSQGSIGGVIQLQPRRARTRELSAGATLGSHGLLAGEASSAVAPAGAGTGPRLLTAAGLTRADGDFELRFDNATALDTSDDELVRRDNADLHQGHALLYGSLPLAGGELSLLGFGFGRVAGEPGSVAEPALRARRRNTRAVLGLAYDQERAAPGGHRAHRLQLLASGRLGDASFSDPLREIGVTARSERQDRTLEAFGRIAGGVGVTPFLELTALASARAERREVDEAFSLIATPASTRSTLAGALEARAHGRLGGGRYELRPSVRVEHTDAELAAEVFGDLTEPRVRDTAATYRAAASATPVPGLTLATSAATGQRMPSLLELFGDGALIAGNVTLGPERSRSYDLSATTRFEAGPLAARIELRGFVTEIDDLVVFVRSNLGQQAPRALGEAHIRGLEAGLQARVTRHLHLSAAATALDGEDALGKELPNRPRLVTHLRPELRSAALGPVSQLRLFAELDTLSSSFDDPSNTGLPKAAQLFVHTGAAALLHGGRTELRLTVRDLFDEQGSDLRGFLLPGRTVLASVRLREELP